LSSCSKWSVDKLLISYLIDFIACFHQLISFMNIVWVHIEIWNVYSNQILVDKSFILVVKVAKYGLSVSMWIHQLHNGDTAFDLCFISMDNSKWLSLFWRPFGIISITSGIVMFIWSQKQRGNLIWSHFSKCSATILY